MSDGQPESGESSVWDRLRRRKVVQWGVACAAAAFATLQGVDIVAQQFGWPEAPQQQAGLQSAGVSPQSIAVMPFRELSGGPDAALIADGFSEEVINSLSRVPDLQVAARRDRSGDFSRRAVRPDPSLA